MDGVVLGTAESFKCLTWRFSTVRHLNVTVLLVELLMYLWMGEEVESRPVYIRNMPEVFDYEFLFK
jgi:hypothetical protein